MVCHSLLQVDHILSDLSTTTRPSSVAPRAWLSFIELDKAVVLVWLDWLVFCEYGFSVSSLWCPLATPTILLWFLLPLAWGISSRLLQQSAAVAPYRGWGVSPHFYTQTPPGYSPNCFLFFLVSTARLYCLASHVVMSVWMIKCLPGHCEQKWLDPWKFLVRILLCYFPCLWFDTDKLGKLESHVLKIVRNTRWKRLCPIKNPTWTLCEREIHFYGVGVIAYFEVCLLISWNDLQ